MTPLASWLLLVLFVAAAHRPPVDLPAPDPHRTLAMRLSYAGWKTNPWRLMHSAPRARHANRAARASMCSAHTAVEN